MNSAVVRTVNLAKEYEKGSTRVLSDITLEFNGQGFSQFLGEMVLEKPLF